MSQELNHNNDQQPDQPLTPASGAEQAYADTKKNVSDTGKALTAAQEAISGLASGKTNVVDAAMAVKGAFDSVKGLSGAISASLMMPVMKALAPFKGQAVLPAGKQLDPVLGIDVHMINIPPAPPPACAPMPHPYIGMLFYPKDWVSCLINTFKKDVLDLVPTPAEGEKGIGASLANNKEAIAGIVMAMANMSASVKFGAAVPRAVTGTATKNIPHIPMGPGFAPAFQAAVKKNVGKAFLGSLFVAADGDPMVGCFHLNYDCWDIGVVDLFKMQRAGAKKNPPGGEAPVELFVPSGTVMAIPWARPVLVNSIPTPINPLSILDKLFKAGLGKLAKLGRALAQKGLNKLNGKVGCGALTAASKLIGTGQSHPVDVASGHFYTDNIDFELPGPIPIVFERTWYSYSEYNGPLGYGWHHSYDIALAIDDIHQVAILRMADGRVTHFALPKKDAPVYNRAEKLTLEIHHDGYYFFTDVKGLIYRFTDKTQHSKLNGSDTHLLQSISNRNGYSIRLSYDDGAVLSQITDSAGRILSFEPNSSGRIVNILAPDPKEPGKQFKISSYSYSAEGDLLQHSDAINNPAYFFYENHLMVKEIWRNGCTWNLVYNKKEGADAKCVEVWGDGNLLHYTFDYSNPECTIVTNSRGFKKKFFHRNGLVTKFIDPNNAEWQYQYNSNSELESEIDPLGNQRILTYDAFGNLNSVIEPNGAFTQINYGGGDFKHKVKEVINTLGGKWTWEYDGRGNLIKEINPAKLQTEFKYTDGLLVDVSNNNKLNNAVGYDADFNLSKIVFANGLEKHFSYDRLGNMVKFEDSEGNVRKLSYDLRCLLLSSREPDGNIKNYAYDKAGNLSTFKDNHTKIEFAYNAMGKLLSRNSAGKVTGYKYDTENNLVQVINENKETFSFEYDPSDRVSLETGFDGLTRKYIHNAAGWVDKIEKPGNRFSRFEHDETGKITKVTYHDESVAVYAYEKNGALLLAENKDAKIVFKRDISGRVIQESNGKESVSIEYDLSGNRTGLKSTIGADITYGFGQFNDLEEIIANGSLTSFQYNLFGLETTRITPGGLSFKTQRDKIGRIIKQDIRNDQFSLHAKSYTWEPDYRLAQVNDSSTGITRYYYDEQKNLSRTILADGAEQLRNPDAVGNLYNSAERNDRVYDKGGRLKNTLLASFKYDEEGNLIEKKETNGKTWGYRWYANGMLESVTRPDGEVVRFKYDALGRRISKTYKNTRTRWFWDGNVPLHEWKEEISTSKVLSTTIKENDGIITWVYDDAAYTPVAKLLGEKQYAIASDQLGTPFKMFNGDGESVWEMQLDSYGKANHSIGNDDDCPFRYQGQYEDVETGLYYNRFRYYDCSIGNYISQDPIRLTGGLKMYGYIKDTNSWTDPMGLKGCEVKAGDGKTHDIVLEISRSIYPETAGHIDDAIKSGKADIVSIDRLNAAKQRADSLRGIPTQPGKDRDEWPMAMFKEGGKGASVRHIDPSDNRGAGSSIGNALSGYSDDTRVKIVVVP